MDAWVEAAAAKNAIAKVNLGGTKNRRDHIGNLLFWKGFPVCTEPQPLQTLNSRHLNNSLTLCQDFFYGFRLFATDLRKYAVHLQFCALGSRDTIQPDGWPGVAAARGLRSDRLRRW